MILTRKVEAFIDEDDKELRAKYYYKLRGICMTAAHAANLMITHMFIQDNSIPYLSEEDREKLVFLGIESKDGRRREILRSSTPLSVALSVFRGKIPACILPGILRYVRRLYEDAKREGTANTPLVRFKTWLPVPILAKEIKNLRFHESDIPSLNQYAYCTFTLFGMPFRMKFGRDRSNNKDAVKAIIAGEYILRISTLSLTDKKIFINLRIDVPQKQYQPIAGKILHAALGAYVPIKCGVDADINCISDRGCLFWDIGTMDDFLTRHNAILSARRRAQKSVAFVSGGRGRKRKRAGVAKWERISRRFRLSRMHAYSRMLVDIAVQHKCDTIKLWGGDPPDAGGERGTERVIYSWDSYELSKMIKYKAKMYGIKVEQDAG